MVASSILVTGANRGLGLELVRQLAALAGNAKPSHIIAACRNPAEANDLIDLAKQTAEKPKISRTIGELFKYYSLIKWNYKNVLEKLH